MSDAITALATVNAEDSALAYSSMAAETPEQKAELFNAISDPAHKLGDVINQVIYVRDVYVELIEMQRTDAANNPVFDAAGEPVMDTVPRIVLIDKDGDTYQAIANSVMNNLARLFKLFGEPTWTPALPIEVKQRSVGSNRVYTFKVRTDLMQ